jgi:hypothetical protein
LVLRHSSYGIIRALAFGGWRDAPIGIGNVRGGAVPRLFHSEPGRLGLELSKASIRSVSAPALTR